MNRVAILSAVMFLSLTTSTLAQHHVHGDASSLTYQGLVNRPIKALSEQQVDDLRNGRGMGLSLLAELKRTSMPEVEATLDIMGRGDANSCSAMLCESAAAH